MIDLTVYEKGSAVTNNSSALSGRNDSKDNPNAITAMQDVPIMISHFLQQTYAVQR